MKQPITLALAVAAALGTSVAVAAPPTSCAEMVKLALPDTTITLAQALPAGANPNPGRLTSQD